MTRFLGRDLELARLGSLFSEGDRLVTIHGPAGVGKTRLALRYAELQLDAFGDAGGVWFCDLAEARDQSGICESVAGAIDLHLGEVGAKPNSLVEIAIAIAPRGRTLLVLDNCEQVVEACAEALDCWLARAPEARFIATSRETLRLGGERVFELRPLSLAAREDSAEVSEAVHLFVDRVRLVRPEYELRAFEIPVVGEIVRRLDALPLAIELAAARMTVLGAEALLARLKNRFDLLSSDSRNTGARHRTLQGAIEWSWNLLDEAEQAALAQCAVFRGGFTPEAAEAVLALPVGTGSSFEVVQRLREKSLIYAHEPADLPGEIRLGLYESILEFASEKLASSPWAEGVHARHSAHYVDIARGWGHGIRTHEGDESFRRLYLEMENLRAIHHRALASGTVECQATALDVAAAMLPILAERGSLVGTRTLLDSTLAGTTEIASAPRGWVLLGRARVLVTHNEHARCEEDITSALSLAHAVDDPLLEASARTSLGNLRWVQGRFAEAESSYVQSLRVLATAPDELLEAAALTGLGNVLSHLGRHFEARARMERAVSLCRSTGDRSPEALNLVNLGESLHADGRLDEAFDCFSASLGAARRTTSTKPQAPLTNACYALLCLAVLEQELGRREEARAHYDEALTEYGDVFDRRYLGMLRGSRGTLAHEEGDRVTARVFYRRSVDELRTNGFPAFASLFLSALGALEATAGNLIEATGAFDTAEVLASEDPWSLEVVAVHRGQLDLERARCSRVACDVETADALRAKAERRFRDSKSLPNGSTYIRFALRMLRRALGDTAEHDLDALVVDREGRWFRAPRGTSVALGRRRRLGLLLLALARHRIHQPGEPVSVDTLTREVWPGDRLLAKAAADRVRVAVYTLRNLGLRGLLMSRESNYLLDPAVETAISTEEGERT